MLTLPTKGYLPLSLWGAGTVNTQPINRVLAKSRLRFGLQVRSKTETKPNFGFERVCEEQSVNFSGSERKKLLFEIQIFLSTHEKPQKNKSQQYR